MLTLSVVLLKSPCSFVIACPWEVILPSALVTRLVRSLTDCALAFCATLLLVVFRLFCRFVML